MKLITEQERIDYLYGKALRLADELNKFDQVVKEMQGLHTVNQFKCVVSDLEQGVLDSDEVKTTSGAICAMVELQSEWDVSDIENDAFGKGILAHAMELKSDDGENPEYDRALVELVGYSHGLPSDAFEKVGEILGIPYGKD